MPKKRVAEDLKTHPYRCRFIDTTTASPWSECYSPDHPMTRTDSRRFRMELLRIISQEFNLVTGSETGHEAAVPYVHYFEGDAQLGPLSSSRFRTRDAQAMARSSQTSREIPNRPQVSDSPVGAGLSRLALSRSGIGAIYNNKLPSLWDRRDLFNLLYNTPPMFMFDKSIWNENKERFVQSYKTTHTAPHDTGYAEMIFPSLVDGRPLGTANTVFQRGTNYRQLW